MYDFDQEGMLRRDAISTAAASEHEAALKRKTHPLYEMRRHAGNQAMQHLLHSGTAQSHGTARTQGAAKAGGDAPVPTRALTDEDRAVDLESSRFKDNKRLQDAFDNNPPLYPGATGPAVEILQQALLDLGFDLPKSTKTGKPDGIYGQETTQIIKGFQWRQGIVKDGITGRQTLGELDGLFSGRTAPGTGSSGPEKPGEEITVSTTDRTPKTFGTCGGFEWSVDWNTNARNGYLVQEITKEFTAEACSGENPDPVFTPRYWEAWRVQTDGGIHGTKEADDDWKTSHADVTKPLDGFPGTKGKWRITGKVFFVNQLDPKAGFKVNSVTDAGILWATTTQPTNLGKVLLTRSEGRTWNCCDGKSDAGEEEKEKT